MSETENTQQGSGSVGGAVMVIFGWVIFGLVSTFNSMAVAAGGEIHSPIADAIGYAVYPISVVILVVSIISLQNSASLWGMTGSWLHMACSALSAASALAVVTLGLLKMAGMI